MIKLSPPVAGCTNFFNQLYLDLENFIFYFQDISCWGRNNKTKLRIIYGTLLSSKNLFDYNSLFTLERV